MAGNLQLLDVRFVDADHAPIGTPTVGEQVYLEAEWTTTNLDLGKSYVVRFQDATAGLSTITIDSSTFAPTSGVNVPFSTVIGGWYASPGQHHIEVTVDATNQNVETTELDNRFVLNYEPLSPNLPAKWIQPLSGEQNVDWSIVNYPDLWPLAGNYRDYRCDDIFLAASQKCGSFSYDGSTGTDFELANFAAMDDGQPVYAVADGLVTPGVTGEVINGIKAGDQTATISKNLGDINGDGLPDYLFTGPSAAVGTSNLVGELYVLYGQTGGFNSPVELSDLLQVSGGDGSKGFVIHGLNANDQTGLSVSTGDLNHDGLLDLAIGAPFSDPVFLNAGRTWVLFGRAGGFPAEYDIRDLLAVNGGTGVDGVVFNGIANGDNSGQSVAFAGDLNGDGFGDLAIAAPRASGPNFLFRNGQTYVVYGGPAPAGSLAWPAEFNLADLRTGLTANGTLGFTIDGAASFQLSGSGIAAAGDMNGDGLADLAVGAPGSGFGATTGDVYVVYGQPAVILSANPTTAADASQLDGGTIPAVVRQAFAAAFEPLGTTAVVTMVSAGLEWTITDGTRGYRLKNQGTQIDVSQPYPVDFALSSLSIGEHQFDVTGVTAIDRNDLNTGVIPAVVNTTFTNYGVPLSPAAVVSLITSGTRWQITDGALEYIVDSVGATLVVYRNANQGFVLHGVTSSSIGRSIAAATDLNGDGRGELLIGATTGGATSQGQVYILNGKSRNFPAQFELNDLLVNGGGDGSQGTVVTGATANGLVGTSFSVVGDMNADGVRDLLVGAPGGNAVYLIYGEATGWDAEIDLSTLGLFGGVPGVVFQGVNAGDRAGQSVGDAGDLNGDGLADLLIGASLADPNGTSSGQAYVVYGQVTPFRRTIDLQLLTNTNSGRIEIDHGGGWITRYDNLDPTTIGVQTGDIVKQGTVLGLVGTRANGTAQLHFEVEHNKAFVETNLAPTSYWLQPLEYQGATDRQALAVGVTNVLPDNDLEEEPSSVRYLHPTYTGPVYFWFRISHLNPRDEYQVQWHLPNGSVVTSPYHCLFPKTSPLFGSQCDTQDSSPIHMGVNYESLTLPWNRNAGDYYVTLKINGQERAREFFSMVSSPIEPRIRVTNGTATLGNPIVIDGRTTPIDFGLVPQGDPAPEQTITIENHGSTALHISQIVVPEGFALVGSAPTSINATESANFVVRMLTNVAGRQFGALRIQSDDATEGDFYYYLEGEVDGLAGANDPRLTLPGPAATYFWGDPPTVLEPQVSIFDADSPIFDGGSLKVELVGMSAPTDVLGIRNQGIGPGQVGIVNSDVFYEGSLVGTWTGGLGATPLQVSFNSQATLVAVRAVTSQITYASTSNTPGTTRRFARYTLVDDLGNVANHPVKVILPAPDATNDLPVVAAVTLDVASVTVPAPVVATATGVGDSDGHVAAVEFYHESNSLVGLQTGPGGDQLLGTDTNGGDGWSLQFASSTIALGARTIYAQAIDDKLARSQSVSAPLLVQPANAPPEIVFVAATPAAVVQPDPVTLTANGVSDSDGSVARVDFYLETNNVAGLQPGGDTLVGSDTSLLGGWTTTFATTGVADGKRTAYAQAIDNLGGASAAASITINVGVQPPAGSVFQLSDLLAANGGDGSTGFVLDGLNASDALGRSVSGAGDVNGDGFDDYLLGAPGSDPGSPVRADAGSVYVVFGTVAPAGASLDLATLNGATGFKINGLRAGDGVGSVVRSAGDVNGDGFADLIVAAPNADLAAGTDAGEAYVVFGKSAGFPATLELSTLNGSNGFRLSGLSFGEALGISAVGVGDVNGDGYSDLVVGASGASPGTPPRALAGRSYLVFGAAGGFAASVNLGALNGSNGIVLEGMVNGGRVGLSAAAAGDVNGDGFADLVLGAQDGPNGGGLLKGAAYVVFGHGGSWVTPLELDTLGGANGFRVDGLAAGDRFGWSVAGLGDFNGDGLDDLAFGAPGADPGLAPRLDAGSVYVVYGTGSGFLDVVDLLTLNGANGIVLEGVTAGDAFGSAVAAAGDVNSDGVADLIVGAYLAAAGNPPINGAGVAYVVFGSTSAITTPFKVSLLDGQNGFRIEGIAANDQSGFAVAGRFDANGDGFDDLLIGAPQAAPGSPARVDAGQAYVFLGRNFNSAVSQIGDANANSLTGNPGANVIVAGANQDLVLGQGGADVLRGGQGDDVLAVADMLFRLIDGGRGRDTLRFDGAGLVLNLAQAIVNRRVSGIETIDITGVGANELVLDLKSVLAVSDTSNQLIVKRNTGDLVTMDAGWSLVAVQTIDGSPYNVFQKGSATLLVAAVAEGAPWQNPANPLDATNDGSAAPQDALVIINYLNLNTSSGDPLPNPPQPGFAPPPLGSDPFFDVNGDGFASAIDALLVINFLNMISGGEGEGVDEASAFPLSDLPSSVLPSEFGANDSLLAASFSPSGEPSTNRAADETRNPWSTATMLAAHATSNVRSVDGSEDASDTAADLGDDLLDLLAHDQAL